MKRSLVGAVCAMAVIGGAFAQSPVKPTAKRAPPDGSGANC